MAKIDRKKILDILGKRTKELKERGNNFPSMRERHEINGALLEIKNLRKKINNV